MNLEQKEGDDLIGDSLELFNNNKHITEVIEKLAGGPLKTETVTVEVPAAELSKFAVGVKGDLVKTEEPSEDLIDPSLTASKPLKDMSEEEKKLADEAIKDNEERKNKILDDLDKMTTEEILSDDIDIMDMFKGCKI